MRWCSVTTARIAMLEETHRVVTPANTVRAFTLLDVVASTSLEDVKRVKNHFGMTVNDVVMALVTTALRRWLLDHDALPTGPLVAAVPVSVRAEDQRPSSPVGRRGVSTSLRVTPASKAKSLASMSRGASCGSITAASLKAALETLGFGPCYHMIEIMSGQAGLSYTGAVTA